MSVPAAVTVEIREPEVTADSRLDRDNITRTTVTISEFGALQLVQAITVALMERRADPGSYVLERVALIANRRTVIEVNIRED